jgi:predicted  nucleic acid-binding Zn-ribbon protein
MNVVLTNLLKLQALDFKEVAETDVEAKTAELRATIPQPILGHYDRLVARGKKGVALVRNQACTGCHMRLPIGTINTLLHGLDIQLCDSCGRYLYLPEPAENATAEATEPAQTATAPARKPRKRKAAAAAAPTA